MVPAILAAGLVSGAIKNPFKGAQNLGKSRQEAGRFDQSDAYNADRYEYGGRPGGADEAAGRYQGRTNEYNATMGNATRDAGLMYQQAGQARGDQAGMAGLMAQRARGHVPSIAQMQADRQMRQAQAAQTSAAASARGPAAMALAQQNAAGNMASAQADISNQAQINAAQERLAAEQAAFGAYSGMRGQDFQGAQQQQQFALGLGQLGQGYAQLEHGVRQSQLEGGLRQQAIQAGVVQNADNLNMGVAQNNANRDMQFLQMGLGATEGAVSMGMQGGGGGGGGVKSDAYAKQNVMPLSGGVLSDVTTKDSIMGLGSGMGIAGGTFGGGQGMAPSFGGGFGGTGMDPSMMGAAQDQRLSADWYGKGGPHQMMNNQLASMTTSPRQARINVLSSDVRAKEGVLGLDDPNLRIGDDGRGYIAEAQAPEMDAGQRHMAKMSARQGLAAAPSPKKAGKPRKMTNDELAKWAKEQLGLTGAQKEAALANGPAVADPMTRSLAAMKPYAYEYKPGMGPSGPNVGPRAQDMASNPITGTAVRQGPDGLLSIDRDNGLKVALGGIGHLAAKQAQLESMVNGGRG
jgi:hypothetical protein